MRSSIGLWVALCLITNFPARGQQQEGAAATEIKVLNNRIGELARHSQFAEAMRLAQRVLGLSEAAFGPNDSRTADACAHLGSLLRLQGLYDQALAFYQRELAIEESAAGPYDAKTADALNDVAYIYEIQEAHDKALPLVQRALSIQERIFGPGHPRTAVSLNNLAHIYELQGAHDRAAPLFELALAISEKTNGADSLDTGVMLSNLAFAYTSLGAYEKALPLLTRALAIDEKALGPNHPGIADPLNDLARVYDSMGAYDEALTLSRRALDVLDKALGRDHPFTQDAMRSLLTVLRDRSPSDSTVCGRFVDFLQKEQGLLLRGLGTGWEMGMRHILTDARGDLEGFMGCVGLSPELTQTAGGMLLDVKARLLEELRGALEALGRRNDPSVRALLNEYADTGRRLAREYELIATQPSPDRRAEMKRLEDSEEGLRQQILAKGPEYRAILQTVPLSKIQATLQAHQTLVDLFIYAEPYFPRRRNQRWGPVRYGAFLIRRRDVVWHDLGPATAIDSNIQKLLLALRAPENSASARRVAHDLYRQLLTPLAADLNASHEVFVAGDGLLRLVPLSALVDDNGHYLIEGARRFHQIGAGRDLVLWTEPLPSKGPPRIVANPRFGEGATPGGVRFPSLPGTEQEYLGIHAQFPEAERIMPEAATPEAVKAVVAPRFLHLATHGFYELPARKVGRENPSLWVGIALTGANRGPDGILRANEVAGMNLQGTSLVVVSGCETGLGAVDQADGVFGLQRSLTLAGARTQILSFWPVDDRRTAQLMTEFYRNLKNGKTKSESLREAQMTFVRQGAPATFWAAFVAFGDPGNLGI
jgi:CHAT domain-containing protein